MTLLTFASLLLAAGLLPFAAYPQAPFSPGLAEPVAISVNVDLVLLHATVQDRNGQFVSTLVEQDFVVLEDGVPQTLRVFQREDVPVTVGLVIDHSGSMRRKLADVLAAARLFARSSHPQDQMFVVNFNENVTLGLPPSIGFSNQPEELVRAITRTPAGGATALYDAVLQAHLQLSTGGPDKKALVVISDGGDTASRHTERDMLRVAAQSSAIIYTLGIFDEDDPDQNAGVLKRLAKVTGGDALFPSGGAAIRAACAQVARDLRNQYTMGYTSTYSGPPGAYRPIRVHAKAKGQGKLTVRTRTGYTTAPAGSSQ
jgi:VWFA-related protein